jgi:hypothetical protein
MAEVSPDRGYHGNAGAGGPAGGGETGSKTGAGAGCPKLLGAVECEPRVELGVHERFLSMDSNVISE